MTSFIAHKTKAAPRRGNREGRTATVSEFQHLGEDGGGDKAQQEAGQNVAQIVATHQRPRHSCRQRPAHQESRQLRPAPPQTHQRKAPQEPNPALPRPSHARMVLPPAQPVVVLCVRVFIRVCAQAPDPSRLPYATSCTLDSSCSSFANVWRPSEGGKHVNRQGRLPRACVGWGGARKYIEKAAASACWA